ncbi:MAG: transketolase [Pseudomonadota bacterium]|nr:transketolase [Pseudomonadota bacterium]
MTAENIHMQHLDYKQMANAIRFLSADAIQRANSGHPGAPLGMADVATVLFAEYMRFTPKDPMWPGRDRFVLSNGHASMLLYSVLHLTGYGLTMDDIKEFRQKDSKTPGHPEFGHTAGVETTTGPLGQGLANAVGMAIGQEKMAKQFGADLYSNKTYVMVGDGCLMEGISHEALEMAGHLKLKNLIVLFDDNGITIDGSTDMSTSTDMKGRIESYGFDYFECDGHDVDMIRRVLDGAQDCHKPVFIAFKTTIGQGAPSKAGSHKTHGEPLGDEEIAEMRKSLGWGHGPFEVPAEVYEMWNSAAMRNQVTYERWVAKFKDSPKNKKLTKQLQKEYRRIAIEAMEEVKELSASDKPKVATRKASGTCISALAACLPDLISGSADLSPSNNTKDASMYEITADDFGGNYIHYGIREHAMGSVMNGLALYGGILPIGGTFLCFADYMRPAMRLAALMNQQVIYVMTHDSIGLGEDGPTHQPVEHMAMLRATPNLMTFRPADQVETAECYATALARQGGPSVMCLSRQGVPAVRTVHLPENKSAHGAYILSAESPELDLHGAIIATGTEVHLALEAQSELMTQGYNVRVISMPCMELFDAESNEYKESVLPSTLTARVGVEAGSKFGWGSIVGMTGKMLSVDDFGMSAPAPEIYEAKGITVKAIVDAMLTQMPA